MGKKDRGLLARVSYHAVARYVNCALGFAVFSDEAEDAKASALAHATAAGMTIDEVKTLILTPTVILGMKLGAIVVRNEKLVVTLRRTNGVIFVHSVSRHVAYRDPIKVDADGDVRRQARRLSVTAKRRPSPFLGMREFGEQ